MQPRFDENDRDHIQNLLQINEKANYRKKENTICVWRLGTGSPATRAEVVLKRLDIQVYVGEDTPAYNEVKRIGKEFFDNHLKHSQYEIALRFRSISQAEPVLLALASGFGTNTKPGKRNLEASDERNVLSALVEHMKQNGIVFSSDYSKGDLSKAYAIMGGKSSVIYRQDADDGVNGYLITCYKDGKDRDRLCSELGKEWFKNGESTRPYKIQIERTEIDKAIEILKKNPLNTADELEEENVKAEMHEPVKWLISANKSFDTVRAFNELGTLDWNQGVYKLREGDIVYIYLGKPIQKVRVKCQVVKADMPYSEIDDRKYITGVTDDEIQDYDPVSYGNTMRLTILEEFVESDLFGAKALEEHGILGQIRTPRTITGEALDYFNEIDVDDNILKYFSEDEIIINEAALETDEVVLDDSEIEEEEILGEEREVITKARVNQSKFRQKLIDRYGQCALCGMNMKELLVASHIKPWVESAAKEKTSVENGLLLCPNHDKLFDQGYIAFENDGSILISSLIDEENYELLGINENMKIELTEENVPFIEYHRQNKHIW
ncbi:HNH endonuclease [Butyrivibrio sp. AE3004]|uniref:HNH endonuclease n=1 Tax=Butyrivibrio sp. AE3004 TaxID=1506994 RepID=UPI000690118B|nr:HNH endonuclease signature motif containing protein [Butyrivibrio sp. AE3004]